MAEGSVVVGRLDSWKDIASYVGRNVRTVIRWEKQRGLPVHRVPGGGRQVVFAYPVEIDQWMRNGHGGENGYQTAVEEDEEPEVDLEKLPAESDLKKQLPGPGVTSSETAKKARRLPFSPRTIWITVGFAGLLGAASAAWVYLRPSQVHLKNSVQITLDGFTKGGLVTDGKTIYFGEMRSGKTVLAMTSTVGGPVRIIPTPFIRNFPVDIARDGSNLLLIEGEEEVGDAGGPLWVVSLPGETLKRVGQIVCDSAAWSPDGRWIAYSAHNSVFIASRDGSEVRQLHSFDAIPQSLRWSSDGKLIRLVLRDQKTLTYSLWDLVLAHEQPWRATSINPLNIPAVDVSSDWSFAPGGNTFVVAGEGGDADLFYVGRQHLLWSTYDVDVRLNSTVADVASVTWDPAGKRVYVTGTSLARRSEPASEQSELIRFVPESKTFRLFMAGTPVTELSLSPDGRRVVYVGNLDQSLWIGNADGSNAQRLLGSVKHLELPRWSPDGRLIAFMARFPDRPWRIFIVPSTGGKIREASEGTDNQGAPTWSPDGKWIVYGNVSCQELGNCSVHKIRVATGEVTLVPGSEGLSTARWSPNGKLIAALRTSTQQAVLYDVARREWRTIANGITGNDLAWSADSASLYAICPLGSSPRILRISVKTGEVASAVDLSDFAKLAGGVEPWFTVAPDGSVLFAHRVFTKDVYALDYSER